MNSTRQRKWRSVLLFRKRCTKPMPRAFLYARAVLRAIQNLDAGDAQVEFAYAIAANHKEEKWRQTDLICGGK